MARLGFLFSVLKRYLQDRCCPYCGSESTYRVATKKLLLELRQCRTCALTYRWPKDDASINHRFYKTRYQQGMVTEVPSPSDLPLLLKANFSGTDKDFGEKIEIVKRLKQSGRLLDFGCSWGYGVYQFKKAGFEAVGFEISAPRAQFGREELGVDILHRRSQLECLADESFDVIFSNHVIEHLPDPRFSFSLFNRLLKRDGVAVLFVPNCGGKRAAELGVRWGPMIGEKHTLALTATFFAKALPTFDLYPKFSSEPYTNTMLDLVSENEPVLGDELLVVARRLDEASSRQVA